MAERLEDVLAAHDHTTHRVSTDECEGICRCGVVLATHPGGQVPSMDSGHYERLILAHRHHLAAAVLRHLSEMGTDEGVREAVRRGIAERMSGHAADAATTAFLAALEATP